KNAGGRALPVRGTAATASGLRRSRVSDQSDGRRSAGHAAGAWRIHPECRRKTMAEVKFEHFNEEWVKRVTGAKSNRGIDGFLGFVITEVERGRLVAEMPVTKELITVMGNMHGGCLSALCDHMLGTVMYPVMPPQHWA